MPFQVISTALTQCSFGTTPGNYQVLPVNMEFCSNQPAANIMDHVPLVNIMPHGMCMSLANPAVAAATAAALGVLTPQPCIPATSSPWTPGAIQTFIANQKALDDTCICTCNWAGVVKIAFAGQVTTFID